MARHACAAAPLLIHLASFVLVRKGRSPFQGILAIAMALQPDTLHGTSFRSMNRSLLAWIIEVDTGILPRMLRILQLATAAEPRFLARRNSLTAAQLLE